MKAKRSKIRFSAPRAGFLHAFVRCLAVLSVAVVVATGVAACGVGSSDSASSPASSTTTTPAASDVGSVSLDLTIGSGIEIDSVGYDISGGTFHQSGTIDVSKSSSASALIDNIPFGTGYAMTMTASSVGTPRVNCSGSASFDVTGAATTGVLVHLICKEVPTTPPPPPAAAVPIPSSFMLALCVALLASAFALLGRVVPTVRDGRSGPAGA